MATDNNIKQATPLNGYHARSTRPAHPTVASPRAVLPQVGELDGAPEPVLSAIAKWHDLGAQVAQHNRKAAEARRAATEATETYKAKVREAIATGGDASKITNHTEKHNAIHAAHLEFARTAAGQLERHGHVIGGILAEHGAALCELADERLAARGDQVHHALDALAQTWEEWAVAFGLRLWASQLAMGTVSVPSFHGGDRHRSQVAAATKPILELLAEPDRLREDEETLTRWRATQAEAAAWAAREYGTNNN